MIKMNGDKKFKEIYDKFGGSYGELIEEHLRVLNELEKCRQLLDGQASKEIKEIKWYAKNAVGCWNMYHVLFENKSKRV